MEQEEKNKVEKKIKKISITARAEEILKEKVNGSKEKVDEFMKKIVDEGISKGDFEEFLEGGKYEFYYYKCPDIYVIFIIKEDEVIIVDFLTEIDFNSLKHRKD